LSSLELRPRLGSEIVDAAFQLYRRHFAELVSLSALIYAPYIVLQLLVTSGQPLATGTELQAGPFGLALLMITGFIVGSVVEAAIVVSVSNSYLTSAPDPGGALRHTLKRLVSVLISVLAKWIVIAISFGIAGMAAIIVGFAVLFATGALRGGAETGALFAGGMVIVMMLLAVPFALWFYARYFAVPATIVLEGRGAFAGLRRSAQLSQGMKAKIIGALGLPMVLLAILQIVVVSVIGFLVPGPRIFGFLLEQAVSVVAYPIIAVIATLLYYDARIRKEAFDIEVMAGELSTAGVVRHTGPDAPAA